jgi:hypothetical protein
MIVFCTTCKGRVQHIERTLPKNLADNARHYHSKFLILDYNSQDDLLGYLKSNHAEAIESGKLVVYSYREPGPFRMAHAKNMAHRLGIREGADILVNLDADNYTGSDFANYVEEKFQTAEKMFLWAGIVRGQGRKMRGCSGRIAVTASAFLSAGGYDEKYDTWAPDDKDFNARLIRLGYASVEIDRQYLESVPHGDGMRFKEYPQVRSHVGSDECELVDSSATVVNFGNYGCGAVSRNFGVELGRLPTRIFGIGMHKTGTTSLRAALELLGFDSAHWQSGNWAWAIWQEMKSLGRSPTLEKHYALSDLPISILYEQLDAAYPGSKFILTTRNEEAWLRSVRNHWSYRNPFRWEWDAYPFSKRIHQEVYGQKEFDAAVFVARFRRHNADVREYFRDRPGDLLVMDMDQNAGWPELCQFLRRPVPAVNYPRAFATTPRLTTSLPRTNDDSCTKTIRD